MSREPKRVRLTLVLPRELLLEVEEFRRRQEVIPPRMRAIVALIRAGLEHYGKCVKREQVT